MYNMCRRLLKLGMSTHFSKITLCYDKKWEEKLFISVNIDHRLLKMGNEMKLCISVNIFCRLLKLGMSTHVFKIGLCYDKKWEKKLCI